MRTETERWPGVPRLWGFARRELRTLWGRRWFRAGFALRLLLIALFVPVLHETWFLPFFSSARASLDAYSHWMARGGDALAWPYGPVMTLAHLPALVANLAGESTWVQSVMFALTLLVADLTIAIALRQLASEEAQDTAARLWWLSPAALVISYWHGQTDLVPLALLVAALALFRRHHFRMAGTLVGLSIAAKLTMAVAPPFFLLWLAMSRRYRDRIWDVVVPMFGIPAVIYGALLFSDGARHMIFESPVASQAAGLSIEIRGTKLLVLPPLLLALMYVAARARRFGFSLMVGILGTALFALAAVVGVAPGWWLCSLPLMALYASRSERREVTLGVWLFSTMLAAQTWLNASGARMEMYALPALAIPESVRAGVLTLTFAIGFVLAISMFRRTLADNDPYGLASRPIVAGFAGQSGSGKDTIATTLARVLGEREVVMVSGDDYHKWERGAPMWKVWTHLNPAANNLRDFTEHVRALASGAGISSRFYDHVTGRFQPRRSKHYNDIVLVSGLHALHGSRLREVLDVKVYLDMDEQLRQFLKLRRDTTERRQSVEAILESLKRREPDGRKYIDPQIEHANLVLRLLPRDRDALDLSRGDAPIALRLEAWIKNGVEVDTLRALLCAFCWCEVEVEQMQGSGDVRFLFEGDDVTGEDIGEIARILVPHHAELLAVAPTFEGGATGVMQLLVLLQIGAARVRGTRRRRS